MGDEKSGPVRLSFNPQLRVESRGATVTSGARLLLPRGLDERLGLSALIERHLTDPRTRRNRQLPLSDLFRQSLYSRLAAYEDTNDAERLAVDPAFRTLASRERRERSVALTSTLHWFETDVLAEERNYQGLSRLNTDLVQQDATLPPTRRVTLDIDSSESPVHGAQEQSAYNGHFESVCDHPLFLFSPAPRHPELVTDEPPAAAIQDRRAPHPACAVLHPPAGRKPSDADPLWADPRAHRATRVAPDLIERTVRRGSETRSGIDPGGGCL